MVKSKHIVVVVAFVLVALATTGASGASAQVAAHVHVGAPETHRPAHVRPGGRDGRRSSPALAVTVETVPPSIADDCSTDVTQSLYDWIDTLPQGTPSAPTEVQFASDGCYLINGMIFLRGLQDFIFDGNGSTFSQTSVSSAELPYADAPPTRAPYCGSNAFASSSDASTALDTILSESFDIMWFVEGGCDLEFENMNIVGTDSAATNVQADEQDSAFEIAGAQRVLITGDSVTGVYGDFVTVTGLHEALYGGFDRPSSDVTITDGVFRDAGRDAVSIVFANRVTVGGAPTGSAPPPGSACSATNPAPPPSGNCFGHVAASAIDIETDVPGNGKGGEGNILVANNSIHNYSYLVSAQTEGQLYNFAFEDNATDSIRTVMNAQIPGQNIIIEGNTANAATMWPYNYDNGVTNEIGGLVSGNAAPMSPVSRNFVKTGSTGGLFTVQDNILNGPVRKTYPLKGKSASGDTECDNTTPSMVSLDAKPASRPFVNCDVSTAGWPIAPCPTSLPRFLAAGVPCPTVSATARRSGSATTTELDTRSATGTHAQRGAVSCPGMTGTLAFDPPLTSTDTSTSEMALVDVTVAGCTASGGGKTPTVGHGVVEVPVSTSSCGDLTVPSSTPTSLVITWSPATLGVTEVVFPGFTTITSPFPGFTLGGPGTQVYGSYPGTEGASLSLTLGDMTEAEVAAACASATGLASSTVAGAVVVGGTSSGFSVPGAPTGVKAVAEDGQALVKWSAPADDGGSPIIGYTVTASSGVSCASATTSCAVTGLTTGVAVTFTVTATNAVGTGPASAPSNSVTPSSKGVPTTTTVSSLPVAPTEGQPVTYTVTVTGSVPGRDPTGTVTFTDLADSSPGCTTAVLVPASPATTVVSSTATCTTTYATAESGTFVASYSGDTTYAPSVGTLVQTIAIAWSAPTSIDPGTRMNAVSCVSASFCVAVDVDGDALTYNGSSWSAPMSVDSATAGLNQLFSVSCVSATFCAAAGGNGNGYIDMYTFNGSSWTAFPTDSSTSEVSCVSSTFCVAVGPYGEESTYNGTTWSAQTQIDPGTDTELTSVSCASATFCAAVDISGNVLVYNGTSWSAPVSIDPTTGLVSVSCVSGPSVLATFCAAVDSDNDVFTYDGASWSAASTIPPSDNTFWSVSCASTSFCVASSDDGNVYSDDGSGWSGPYNVDGSAEIYAVSCPTTSFCAAVDEDGNALTYP